ncbi:MAG: DUF6067 family protein [Rikenellaceae bacterium]
MKFNSLIAATLLLITGCGTSYPDGDSINKSFAPDGIPFTVVDTAWRADMQGNHRAIVKVSSTEEAVVAALPWRRADPRFDQKKVLVVSAATGQEVKDVYIKSMSDELGEIVFKPESGSGEYYLYYMPYKYLKGWNDARYGEPWNHYLPAEYEADQEWLENVKKDIDNIPECKVERFESRSEFDFLTSMGTIATDKEVEKMRNKFTQNPAIFIEDRAFPIRLREEIPVRWVNDGVNDNFKGGAMRNEYYTWQVAVWALLGDVENVKLKFSDLKNGNETISSSEITCFNQEGTNWDGKPLDFTINVEKDKIQALWCGVQIPESAKAGIYRGVVTITGDNIEPQSVNIAIDVENQILADKGDGDLWRHARLRWLNSQIGVDSLPVAPYEAMELNKNTIIASGKEVTLSANGLVESAIINGKQIFASPISFEVITDKGGVTFKGGELTATKVSDGLVEWTSSQKQGDIEFICNASMEYDGYIRYNLEIKSAKTINVKDVRLVNSFSSYTSKYFMGVGYKGGLRPSKHTFNWDGPYDSFWMGNELAGAHIEYRGGTYHGPLIQDYKPAPTPQWSNDGKGKVEILTATAGASKVIASTGANSIDSKGLSFDFDILLTPVKQLDPEKQFTQRYFHSLPVKFEKAAQEGANICNIHHARNLNPVINYPFIVRDSLIDFIDKQHEQERKVKLYYTIRELSNYTKEIYAFSSLGNEIYQPGPGYGTPWHTEHLIDGYKAAWYTELPGETADAALVTSGFSRYINYYLEGLRWMYENYKLDGIYMDDVSFDRTVMKRMRKISAEYRPGALVDLHSNTGYSIGPMNQYTDFFPYVDRLWFGESFQYNAMTPDEWFVTFSGIPFGQMSEMLQGGGNRFLGMVYGATGRHSYSQFNPSPVWALWESFGIKDAEIVGYWSEKPAVTCNNSLVKATAYVKDGQTLIAVGNFSDKDCNVKVTIDFKALGLDASKVKVTSPEIERFQKAASYDKSPNISIKAKEGVILLVN